MKKIVFLFLFCSFTALADNHEQLGCKWSIDPLNTEPPSQVLTLPEYLPSAGIYGWAGWDIYFVSAFCPTSAGAANIGHDGKPSNNPAVIIQCNDIHDAIALCEPYVEKNENSIIGILPLILE